MDGTWWRWIYNGERVLERTTDGGSANARHTTENGSYYAPLLGRRRGSVNRFPLYDGVGTVRMVVDGSGVECYSYYLDAFGRYLNGMGSTYANPHRFGGAWGYITDPSGLLQLGARFYWPEIGRFVQQDPVGDGVNWYAYAEGNPVYWIDPNGLDLTIPGFGGQPLFVFDDSSWARLGMSAKATASGFAAGFTAGMWRPDWRDPCDPWGSWSRNWGMVSGGATAAAIGAKVVGFNPRLGGVKLNQPAHHTFRIWGRYRYQARHVDVWIRNPLSEKSPLRMRIPHSGFRWLKPKGRLRPPVPVPPLAPGETD